MIKRELLKKQNEIFAGRVFRVRCDDVLGTTGRDEKREIVLHNGGVGVVPVDKDDVILIRQYRYCFDKETLEIPAGKLEKGEDPLQCGIRELAEEAGARGEMTYLTAVMSSPGFTNEVVHVYKAENLEFFEAAPDEGEEVETVRIPLKEAVEMIKRGEISDGKTVTGILLAYLDRIKA